MIRRVIDQTRRRVFSGERVPAADKLVSLFEPHADIIVKDRRAVAYVHKLNLTRGRSGLIFDAVIEAGISCLKRAYGQARCTWKELAHF